MSTSRRNQALYGTAIAALALALLAKCAGTFAPVPLPVAAIVIPATPELVATPEPQAPAPTAIVVARKAKPVLTPKPVAKKKVAVAKKKKKLRADVAPKDFVVSGVSVSQAGYTAKIEGWVRMTRKGALAQPRMTFDLTDGNGDLIRAGSFTPVDATGPVWMGYDSIGLKRVPFTTTVDLRAENGGVLPSVPPRPYSASVRVAEVIDAKPSK